MVSKAFNHEFTNRLLSKHSQIRIIIKKMLHEGAAINCIDYPVKFGE